MAAQRSSIEYIRIELDNNKTPTHLSPRSSASNPRHQLLPCAALSIAALPVAAQLGCMVVVGQRSAATAFASENARPTATGQTRGGCTQEASGHQDFSPQKLEKQELGRGGVTFLGSAPLG